jgi:D-alanine-D-alanine ligase
MSKPQMDPTSAPERNSEGAPAATMKPEAASPEPQAEPEAKPEAKPARAARAKRRVVVLYNNDYDTPTAPGDPDDRSAVARAACDVRDAVDAYGYEALISGVYGYDVARSIDLLHQLAPDLVFNLTESLNQDSRNEIVFPALFEMLQIPFTGSGALGLGLCLHKPKAKDILRARGVPTPASCVIERARDAAGVDLPYPLFVKLAHEDASVGIRHDNVVTSKRALVRRIKDLLEEYHQPVLIERYIEGREVNVTLLGNARVAALPFHEIDFSKLPPDRPRIVSYAAKWDESSPEYKGTEPVPVKELPLGTKAAIERAAIAAFRALELRDYGRVDFRVSEDGTPYVIDVNPNCDISPDAGVARAARAGGLKYPQLIGRICDIALERYRNANSKARAA